MTPRPRSASPRWLAGALWLACVGGSPPPLPCTTDSDCQGPAICFADGCGDPGRDIVVQVTHGSTAQEYEISELRATFDQQLRRPSVLSGTVRQATATGPVPYTGKVEIQALGSALFIPGVPRRGEVNLIPTAGEFSLLLGSGFYSSITATGLDPTIPPVVVGGGQALVVEPGDQPEVDITFPRESDLVRISGLLLKTAALGPVPAPMEVLLLHPTSRRPITQEQPVDPLTGAFSVLAPPAAVAAGSPVLLMARPRAGASTPEAIIPQHIFTVATPTAPLLLELGEFGATVAVTGQVEDADGEPVTGATVYIEGTATGGGTFRTGNAQTGDSGQFSLFTLPSAPGGGLTLWVLTPPTSSAGRLQAQVVVPPLGGSLGTLECPERVKVQGKVRRPDGLAPAAGVSVRAEPVGGIQGNPPPSSSRQAVTDTDGRFSFLADPGQYRLDFVPPDTLPRVSRRVRVESVLQGNGEPLPVEVPAFTLWNARTLTGTITGFDGPEATQVTPLQGASVELWRVVLEDGKKVAYSLGQGTTDENGHYSVQLPTAPPTLLGAPDGGG